MADECEDDCFEFDLGLIQHDNFGNEIEEMNLDDPGTNNPVPEDSVASARQGRQDTVGSKQRLPCTRCNKTFANNSTLNAHLRRHNLKGIAARFPSGADIGKEDLNELIINAVLQVIDTCKVGSLAEKVKVYAEELRSALGDFSCTLLPEFLCHHFQSLLSSSKAVLSSGLRSSFLSETNTLLNSSNFIFGFKSELNNIYESTDTSVLNVFVGVVLHKFCQLFLIFVLKKVHNAPVSIPSRRLFKDKIDTDDFEQIIFYIGGSVLHKFFKLQKRFPQNERLKSFCQVLHDKFQDVGEENLVEESEDVVEDVNLAVRETDTSKADQWTRQRDRGGLLYLTKDAHQFFTVIAEFVLDCESERGTLSMEDVYEGVLRNSDVISMWDRVVGESIEEQSSLDYLQCICEVLVKCCRRGILKRRLNAALQRVYSSVSLRHRLARN